MSKSMKDVFSGLVLTDCYSNSKEDIHFVFPENSMNAIFYKSEVYFRFSNSEVSKSRLFKPCFTEIIGKKLESVQSHRFDRSFSLHFENNYELSFLCHGRKSVIILYKDSIYISKFGNSHSDLIFNKNLKLTEVQFFEKFSDEENIRSKNPFLPDEFFEMKNKTNDEKIKILESISGFDFEKNTGNLLAVFNRNTVLNDLSQFTNTYLTEKRFLDLQKELLSNTIKSISDINTVIESNKNALLILENKRSDEEIGNIILSSIHLIKPGDSQSRLYDIYKDEEIIIKMDPELSPVENAEKYFKKARGIPYKISQLKEKIANSSIKLTELNIKMKTILSASSLKQLKPFINSDKLENEKDDLPFRRFYVKEFEILVGKNAESNEKLLNQFSNKNDLWFHAKDVSGSHVVLKSGKKENIPINVIEAAASLAAWYSKSRNQSLATVICTQRKYVRKIKGAEKGKVSVSNEKTYLVKPALPFE